MVAKFYMCVRKVSNLSYYFLFILFIFILSFFVLLTTNVNNSNAARKVNNFFFFIFFFFFILNFYYFSIFINNQGNQHKNAEIVKYSPLFVSGKKATLSYERRACFDSD